MAAGAQCYYPDGSISDDIPCRDPTSACCSATSYCLTNGYCLSDLQVIRSSCTDQTWQSPDCPTLCIRGEPSHVPWKATLRTCVDIEDIQYINVFYAQSSPTRPPHYHSVPGPGCGHATPAPATKGSLVSCHLAICCSATLKSQAWVLSAPPLLLLLLFLRPQPRHPLEPPSRNKARVPTARTLVTPTNLLGWVRVWEYRCS